jgi:hypothetical protein
MQYKATFTGREVGAIGKFYPITAVAKGKNEEEARLNLYEKWDHITGLKLELTCYCGYAGVDYCDYCAGLRTPCL